MLLNEANNNFLPSLSYYASNTGRLSKVGFGWKTYSNRSNDIPDDKAEDVKDDTIWKQWSILKTSSTQD